MNKCASVQTRLCNNTRMYVGAECVRMHVKHYIRLKNPMNIETQQKSRWKQKNQKKQHDESKKSHTQRTTTIYISVAKYNNSLGALSLMLGFGKRDDTTTQRHNGDNKYEYATEKRLKWVSSKCTHYYSYSLCVYVAVCRFMRYCYRFALAFSNCGGYLLLLTRLHLRMYLYVWRLIEVLVYSDSPMLSGSLPRRSDATCSPLSNVACNKVGEISCVPCDFVALHGEVMQHSHSIQLDYIVRPFLCWNLHMLLEQRFSEFDSDFC